MARCFDEVGADESPIGYVPKPEDINLEESGVSIKTLSELLTIDKELWKKEAEGIREFYGKFGDKLPRELLEELEKLEKNLGK